MEYERRTTEETPHLAPRYWPLARGFVVTSPFGRRGAEFHWGTDFGKDGGSGGLPVFAAQGGTVVNAGAATGFGQWVVVDHPTEAGSGTTVYGHVIPEVRVGTIVGAGQRIARINPDPNTNGGVAPHLHFEVHRSVWVPPGPDRLDPLPWLQGAAYPGESDPNVQYFADVSEFQVPLDSTYPHRILIIRSNDGDYYDKNFDRNYATAREMLAAGQLDVVGVYFYWRSNWEDCVRVHTSRLGSPHPRMFSMIDVESGYGNERLGNVSDQLNRTHAALARWYGDARRVIGYANKGDFAAMWPDRPAGLRVIGAGYPTDPKLPGQIAHQYTNGQVMGGGPVSARPFGNCDMNKTPLTVAEFAGAVGIDLGGTTPPPPPAPDERVGWIERIRRALEALWGKVGERLPV